MNANVKTKQKKKSTFVRTECAHAAAPGNAFKFLYLVTYMSLVMTFITKTAGVLLLV